MRPRCCFRYLTFFGINITRILKLIVNLVIWESGNRVIGLDDWPITRLPNYAITRLSLGPSLRPPRRPLPVFLFAAALRHQALALVEPHLDADLAVGRVRFGEAVVDVGAQRLRRQLAVQVPLRAGDFR